MGSIATSYTQGPGFELGLLSVWGLEWVYGFLLKKNMQVEKLVKLYALSLLDTTNLTYTALGRVYRKLKVSWLCIQFKY